MKVPGLFSGALALSALVLVREAVAEPRPSSSQPAPSARTFEVSGVVQAVKAGENSLVIRHEAVPGYMDAMTMPFKVKEPKDLTGVEAGDRVRFRLFVTETESWIDRVARNGGPSAPRIEPPRPPPTEAQLAAARHPLLDCKFTNELGQAVSLGDFRGQALAITFFFTRCPIPDYCPRLSKNFEEASLKLRAMPNAPTNWHFLSVSFDTDFDTPPVLRAYGKRYAYDPAHWSFLTGPTAQVSELAAQSDVKFDRVNGLFNHNFRTLIIDAAGHLQTTFPIGGNLSEAIVGEIVKAAAVTNR